MTRLVLDTNVVISATFWAGSPRLLFQVARVRQVALFTSPLLPAELRTVLNRAKFQNRIAASQLSAGQLVTEYEALCTVVRPSHIPRTASDPDDDTVLATALAAQADLIVSGDQHLLSLRYFEGIQVVQAAKALDRLQNAQ